jgi:ariadne-1
MADVPPAPTRQETASSAYSMRSSGTGFDDDDDAYDFEVDIGDGPPNVSRQASEKVLDASEIMATQEVEIGRICELFAIPRTDAAILLHWAKWKSERLIDRWMEDPEGVAHEAGLERSAAAAAAEEGGDGEMCLVCCQEGESMSAPRCGHRYCDTCWGTYLTGKVEEGVSASIGCMEPSCTVSLEAAYVQALTPSATFAKYSQFARDCFVAERSDIKWCPAPGCTKAIHVGSTGSLESKPVSCSCGFVFCFNCSHEVHYPLSCDQLDKWMQKAADDSQTAKWIKVNTKKCPKCKWPIEKNGGCNHMTCRRAGCGHEFCWLCMGDYRSHTTCNRHVDRDIESTKAELEKYIHYYERYEVHAQSQHLEGKLRESAAEKMDAAVADAARRCTHSEMQYVLQAVEQLIQCRRVLKFTYAFAYTMADGVEKDLFEYLQAELDAATEAISRMIEADDVPERLALVNKTADAKARLAKFKEGVESGFQTVGTARASGGGGSSSSSRV